jgi:hypothetical protein
MIGPECVAQQKKLVNSRIMNCGERNAALSDISGGAASPDGVEAAPSSAGRATHQQCDRDHDRGDHGGQDLHRGPPVMMRNQRGDERRHGHGRHPHTG